MLQSFANVVLDYFKFMQNGGVRVTVGTIGFYNKFPVYNGDDKDLQFDDVGTKVASYIKVIDKSKNNAKEYILNEEGDQITLNINDNTLIFYILRTKEISELFDQENKSTNVKEVYNDKFMELNMSNVEINICIKNNSMQIIDIKPYTDESIIKLGRIRLDETSLEKVDLILNQPIYVKNPKYLNFNKELKYDEFKEEYFYKEIPFSIKSVSFIYSKDNQTK